MQGIYLYPINFLDWLILLHFHFNPNGTVWSKNQRGNPPQLYLGPIAPIFTQIDLKWPQMTFGIFIYRKFENLSLILIFPKWDAKITSSNHTNFSDFYKKMFENLLIFDQYESWKLLQIDIWYWKALINNKNLCWLNFSKFFDSVFT